VPNTVYFIDTPLGTVKGNQAHSILYHTSANILSRCISGGVD